VDGLVVAQNGERQEVRAAATVLAVDGFAGNHRLVAEHLAALGSPFYGGVATSTGDALPWLTELGVPLRNLGAALRSGLVAVGHGTRVSPGLPFNGAVLVNQRGERFVDEQAHGYSSLSGVLQQQPGEKAALVWDATAMAATRESEMMRESVSAGAISTVATLPELAQRLGLSEAETASALAPLPGRRALESPYHLAWVTHGVLASQGGAVIDPHGRVLDATERAIPGLYAAGGTACGLAGPSSDGYLSGNGLLSAFGMGWIIGNSLAGVGPSPVVTSSGQSRFGLWGASSPYQ
jgi:fumarate reductase flavoprotein subunit